MAAVLWLERSGRCWILTGLSLTSASLNEGVRAVRVAVQVLAEERGAIAHGVEGRGHRRLLVAQGRELGEAAVRRDVGVDLVIVRIEAGQDGGARRAAERQGHEVLRERHPLLREERPRLRHGAHRVEDEVLVVGEDEDDVRADRGRRNRRSRQAGGESAEEERDERAAAERHAVRVDEPRRPRNQDGPAGWCTMEVEGRAICGSKNGPVCVALTHSRDKAILKVPLASLPVLELESAR